AFFGRSCRFRRPSAWVSPEFLRQVAGMKKPGPRPAPGRLGDRHKKAQVGGRLARTFLSLPFRHYIICANLESTGRARVNYFLVFPVIFAFACISPCKFFLRSACRCAKWRNEIDRIAPGAGSGPGFLLSVRRS